MKQLSGLQGDTFKCCLEYEDEDHYFVSLEYSDIAIGNTPTVLYAYDEEQIEEAILLLRSAQERLRELLPAGEAWDFGGSPEIYTDPDYDDDTLPF